MSDFPEYAPPPPPEAPEMSQPAPVEIVETPPPPVEISTPEPLVVEIPEPMATEVPEPPVVEQPEPLPPPEAGEISEPPVMEQPEPPPPPEAPEIPEPPVMEQPEPLRPPEAPEISEPPMMEQPETNEGPVDYDSVNEALMNTIENQTLKNHADAIYRPGATTGDGGTAAALFHEKETGELVGGKPHEGKSLNRSNGLENVINKGEMDLTDQEIAKDLKEDLNNAIKYKPGQ